MSSPWFLIATFYPPPDSEGDILEYMHDSQCSYSRHNLVESNSIEIGKFTWEGRFWKTIGVGVCVLGGSIALFCFSHLSRTASENVLFFLPWGVATWLPDGPKFKPRTVEILNSSSINTAASAQTELKCSSPPPFRRINNLFMDFSFFQPIRRVVNYATTRSYLMNSREDRNPKN